MYGNRAITIGAIQQEDNKGDEVRKNTQKDTQKKVGCNGWMAWYITIS